MHSEWISKTNRGGTTGRVGVAPTTETDLNCRMSIEDLGKWSCRVAPNSERASRNILSRQTVMHFVVITLFAGSVFFTNLGSAKLWDRDEPRNAGCASEMLQRGDWVVPVFNSELRHQKPVLLYWFIMSAYLVLGETELSARIWSAFLGLGTVWMTYGIARRLVNPTAGLIASMALSTSVMFSVAARAATPDSILIFFSTLAVLLYVLGTFACQRDDDPAQHLKMAGSWFPHQYRYVLGMYAAMAMAVLAKGPVGLILPTAIIGMFLLIQRLPPLPTAYWNRQGRASRLAIACFRPFSPLHFLKTCWSMRPITAIVLVLLIAGPWYVLVGIKTEGDFLNQFLMGENFGRATVVLESHRGGILFYPLTLLIGFFPWAIFCFPTALTIDRQISQGSKYRTAILFALCWIGVQISLFTIASTKLPSYVTPCYPAIGILIGLNGSYLDYKQIKCCENLVCIGRIGIDHQRFNHHGWARIRQPGISQRRSVAHVDWSYSNIGWAVSRLFCLRRPANPIGNRRQSNVTHLLRYVVWIWHYGR